MTGYITKNCKKHGNTIFKFRQNKKSSWYSCEICLQNQWAKAQKKRRKNIQVRDYQKEYSASYAKIKRSLSVYLTMILLAANIKPE